MNQLATNPYVKAGFATLVTLGPVAIRAIFSDPSWTVGAIILYVVFVYIGSLKLFEPDERFMLVRNPTLDSVFQATFDDSFGGDEGDTKPFRVFVFQPSGVPFCSQWFRRLNVVYSFNTHITHPDHGISWPYGHGLCWDVFTSGTAKWCHRNDSSWHRYGMTNAEQEATKHVWGVFAVPLRRAAKTKSDKKVSGDVTAVLVFDAISEQGAEVLKRQFEDFRNNQNKELMDRAAWVSLYF